ncbi:hypothetical protein ANN_08788, partial [Periplaneta americana]
GFDGVVTHSVPAGNHVNGAYYSYFLEHHLRPALRRKCANLLNSYPIVLHDDARSHIVALVVNLLPRQCHDGLVEACGKTALPYRTVARWVRALNEGRDRVENMARPGRPSASEEEVQAVSLLLDNDRRQTMKEPLREVRFRTVPDILPAVGRSLRNTNRTGAANGILRLPYRW